MENVINGEVSRKVWSNAPIFTVTYNTRQYQLNLDLTVVNGKVTKIIFDIDGLMTKRFVVTDYQSHTFDHTSDDKYIGIKNRNANITHKSLYISGTPQYNYGTFPLNQSCGFSERSTAAPTTSGSPTTHLITDATNNLISSHTLYRRRILHVTPSPTTYPVIATTTTTTTQTVSIKAIGTTPIPTAFSGTTRTPTAHPTSITNDPTTEPTIEPTTEPATWTTLKLTDIPTRSFVKISIMLYYEQKQSLSSDIRSLFVNITKDIIMTQLPMSIINCIV